MTAIVDAKAFSLALDNTMAALRRSSIPILESVQLQFGTGKCVLTATDMDTWLTVEVPARGDTFACGFFRTKEAAKTCRYYDGPLTIETVDTGEGQNVRRQILLSCGFRKAAYTGFSPIESEHDFPSTPTMETDAESFTISNAASLLEQINRIKYAVGKTRDNMNAAQTCVQFDRDKVFCMDGYRVACEAVPGFTVPKPFLVYPEALAHLKLFGQKPVTVHVGAAYVRFAGEGVSIVCQRQGVTPFMLDRAIPTQYQEEFFVSPKEFLRELNYLNGLIPQKGSPRLRLCNGELSLESGRQNGCTSIHVDGRKAVEVGFDVNYMTDALKQFEKEKAVRLRISSPLCPMMLDAEGRSDFALVLPARLKEARTAA